MMYFTPMLSAGSSPRWRGRRRGDGQRNPARGLIPALAGTTASRSTVPSPTRAHPRVGGDDSWVRSSWTRILGSSPRWRGRRSGINSPPSVLGLIPALAGTTTTRRTGRATAGAHPRVGGDDRRVGLLDQASGGSSPRWRGRQRRGVGVGQGAGLIPALAGTTPQDSPCPPAATAHPRVGGDDVSTIAGIPPAPGSSPRWRGRHCPARAAVSHHGEFTSLCVLGGTCWRCSSHDASGCWR